MTDVKVGTSIAYAQPAASDRLGLVLDYGTTANNGNVLTQVIGGTGASFSQTYNYDQVNRLCTVRERATATPLAAHPCGNTGELATEETWRQVFQADRWGNLWVAQHAGTGMPYSGRRPTQQTNFDANTNRLMEEANQIAYNETGELTRHGGWNLVYDGEGRIKSSENTGTSATTAYTYDGEGRRVTKTEGSTTTWYVYDAFGQLAAEYKTGGPTGDPATHYVTTDHLGSTRLVTDGSGNAVSRHDYLPFGEEIPSGMGARTSGQHYITNALLTHRFTGKERDTETGLDYFGARYLSGVQGRWTGADAPLIDQNPENPQSWNLYAYGRNNPLRNRDLDGRICIFGVGNTCDEKLPPPPLPPPPPPAPAMTSPLMASSIAGLRVNSLTVQQVGNVVFNETQSVSTQASSNEPIDAARVKVASVVINGDQQLGESRPATGSTSAPSQAQLENSQVSGAYASSQAAAREAYVNSRLGLPDATGGALNFNLRPNASTGPFFGIPLATQSGPYANSYPSRDLPAGRPVYINTYRRRRP